VRLATIDLGSNTVRFLAVEAPAAPTWRVIDQDQTVTRLAEGLTHRGVLGEGPMARTQRAVEAYVERSRRARVEAVRIVATSAVRQATNGADFAMAIGRATGYAVDIVSGQEEARLTLRGIAAGLGLPTGTVVAFDIGGGSTEYILAVDGVLRVAVSLSLGVVPLAEQWPGAGPLEEGQFQTMCAGIRDRLEAELPAAIRLARPATLIGTAGTATTLAALDLGLIRYDASRVQGHVLGRGALDASLARLARLTVEERGALPCLEPGRADLIIPGTAIVMATLDCLGLEAMQVSDWGIREGIIADMLEGAS